MRTRILFLLLAIASILELSASHMRGGEIIWYCISQDNRLAINAELNSNFTVGDHGKFVFVAKLYGDCTGAISIFNSAQPNFVIAGYAGGGPNSSPSILVSQLDVSPSCFSPGLTWNCGVPITTQNNWSGPTGGSQAPNGAVAEFIYRSNAMQLNGAPALNGAWVVGMQFGGGFRNSSSNSGGGSMYLKAELYPYPDVANPRTHGAFPPFKNNFPCYDNSPKFLEQPNVVSCIGYQFLYGPLAFDVELDSIVYDWGVPLVNPTTGVNWTGSYTFNNPLPTTPPNVGAVMDPVSGLVSFESHTNGQWLTNTEVTAYKCGIPVAAIYRDIQIVTINCAVAYTGANPPMPVPVNNPPSVTFIPDTTLTMTTPAVNTFRFTVMAKDTVRFTLNAQDFDLLPNSQFQTITFMAASGQLGGSNWTDTNDCLNAPCALINPATGQSGYVATLNNTIEFFWETDCQHLASETGCGVFSNEYVYYLKMEDNFCPANARSLITVIVDVQAGTGSNPELFCVSRNGNGFIDIDFLPNADTGFKFNYHIIEVDTVGVGNFFKIDSIGDYNPGTWSIADTFPHPSFFKVRTNVDCDFLTSGSNVVGTIDLDLTSFPLNTPDKDTADLKWNDPRPADTTTITYEVQAEIPAGSDNWMVIGASTLRDWVEGVPICSLDINFRVRYRSVNADSSFSCYSYSNIDGDLFSDVTNDDTIVINVVTVNNDGKAVIDFQASNTGDIVHYYVLYFNETINDWEIIDTVGGMAPYIWQNSMADSRIERFKVVSADSCDNVSDIDLVIPHNTLLLNSDVDVCGGTNTLTWNRYRPGWGNSIIGYELRADIDDQMGTVLLDEVLFVGGPNDTVFVQTDFVAGASYCYKAVAIHMDSVRESVSCPKCMFPGVPSPSEILYLSETDVRGDGIFFRGFVDGNADADQIIIERATKRNGTYFEMTTIQAPRTAPYTFTYIDYLAQPNDGVYYYRLTASDSCGGVDTTSNIVNNILVEVEAKSNEQNWVSWNSYKGFVGELVRYEVYRSEGPEESFSLLTDNLGPNDTIFVDRIGNVASDKSTLCYYVRAVEINNPLPIPDGYGPFRSRSNRRCVTQKAKLVLPNAFNPLSPIEANRRFGVMNRYVDMSNFEMIVIDRWGKVVYEAKDPNEGWDGYVGGKLAPTGVYTYLIRYQSVGDLPQELRGTFTLIK
ncbi:MAG: gliding motility-associated C-terminal domain-containing protein [Cryomorphaceae bacterium]|nr:gliding motility-associated C-terminal domain-containing protein [Cryomorphaceae bacterium]